MIALLFVEQCAHHTRYRSGAVTQYLICSIIFQRVFLDSIFLLFLHCMCVLYGSVVLPRRTLRAFNKEEFYRHLLLIVFYLVRCAHFTRKHLWATILNATKLCVDFASIYFSFVRNPRNKNAMRTQQIIAQIYMFGIVLSELRALYETKTQSIFAQREQRTFR